MAADHFLWWEIRRSQNYASCEDNTVWGDWINAQFMDLSRSRYVSHLESKWSPVMSLNNIWCNLSIEFPHDAWLKVRMMENGWDCGSFIQFSFIFFKLNMATILNQIAADYFHWWDMKRVCKHNFLQNLKILLYKVTDSAVQRDWIMAFSWICQNQGMAAILSLNGWESCLSTAYDVTSWMGFVCRV